MLLLCCPDSKRSRACVCVFVSVCVGVYLCLCGYERAIISTTGKGMCTKGYRKAQRYAGREACSGPEWPSPSRFTRTHYCSRTPWPEERGDGSGEHGDNAARYQCPSSARGPSEFSDKSLGCVLRWYLQLVGSAAHTHTMAQNLLNVN